VLKTGLLINSVTLKRTLGVLFKSDKLIHYNLMGEKIDPLFKKF